MGRIGGYESHIVGVLDKQPSAGPDRCGHAAEGLLRIGQVEQQCTAVHYVVSGGLELVGEDVMAADFDTGLSCVREKAGVGVGGHDPAGRSGLGGQPSCHRSGTGAHVQAVGAGQRPACGQPAEGLGVVARFQQKQPAQFIVEGCCGVKVAAGLRAAASSGGLIARRTRCRPGRVSARRPRACLAAPPGFGQEGRTA